MSDAPQSPNASPQVPPQVPPQVQPQDPVRWVDEHGDGLFRYAMMRVRSRQVAEDLVQETFLAALEARHRFAGASSERTWLVSILRHKLISHLRQEQRGGSANESAPRGEVNPLFFDERGLWKRSPGRWSLEPDRLAEQGEFWGVLQQCLERLPRRVADVFCLREMDQLSSERICELLGISANNLWTRLHRARMLLRQCLEQNWYQRSDEA